MVLFVGVGVSEENIASICMVEEQAAWYECYVCTYSLLNFGLSALQVIPISEVKSVVFPICTIIINFSSRWRWGTQWHSD